MEIYGSNDKFRVIMGLSTLLFWAAGFIAAPVIVHLLQNWRICFLVMTSPTLFFIFYAWIIPESPLWLINKNRQNEADAILVEIAEKNGQFISDDFINLNNLEKSPNEEDESCNACCSLIATPRIRARTFILSFLFFVASFVYYGLSLNQSSVGGDDNQFLTFTLYGLMEIPALIFAIFSLSCFGRRTPTVLMFLLAGKLFMENYAKAHLF